MFFCRSVAKCLWAFANIAYLILSLIPRARSEPAPDGAGARAAAGAPGRERGRRGGICWAGRWVLHDLSGIFAVWKKNWKIFANNYFANNYFANFWRARSRLYQNEILQVNVRLTSFFKFYKICTLLHRSKRSILAKNQFNRTAIFVKFQLNSCKIGKTRQTFPEFEHFSYIIL